MHATADHLGPYRDEPDVPSPNQDDAEHGTENAGDYHVSSQQIQRRVWEEQHRQLRGQLLQMILENERKRQQGHGP